MKGFLVAICILCCYSTRLATGLEATLADLPPNGLVMNPESGIPPAVNLVCSYTVDPGETMQGVYFYKDGTTDSDQIVAVVIADGSFRQTNSFATRTDVTVTASDPSFTVTIGTVTLADEGSYYCKVTNIVNSPFSFSRAQTLKLVYRPNPPQITRGPQVGTDTYRVTCSSDGGRPAPEIRWFKVQSSDQMQVTLNETSGNVQNQGDTFLVESAVDVMATQENPVELICQLLHDSLISQTTAKITVPESAAPPTTTTEKPANSTAPTKRTAANTGGLDGGAVAGIVIAVLIIVAIIVGVVVFLVRRRSAEPRQPKEEQTGAENPAASQTDVRGGNTNPAYPDQRDEKPPIEEYKPEPTTV